MLHVVLIEPEIPPNTGAIGRLCLAVGARLHLVHPLGFELSSAQLKRARLDYWEHLDVQEHASAEEFFACIPEDAQKVLLSKKAGNTIWEHSFRKDAWLIFGNETAGLSETWLAKFPLDTVRIPMGDARVRSLNLAQAAGIVVYEALRQNRYKT